MGLVAGLLLGSCSSNPPQGSAGGPGGTRAGDGGANAGAGGSSGGADGGAGNQTGGQATGGVIGGSGGGAGGGVSTAGTSAQAGGGESDGGMGGLPEGGAGGADAEQGGAGGTGEAPFEGRCGEAWAAGGGGPRLEGDVTPEADKSGNYSFAFGRYRLVVAASRGARVTEFSIDGNNLLEPSAGSTFWPSPQQAYPWPPPAELDSEPYAARVDSTSLTLVSDVATGVGLSVVKRFWVNAETGIVSIEYRLTNESKKTAFWAPWEVTHVRAGGYTFAPQGPGNRTITQDAFQNVLPLSLLPEASSALGIEWLNYPSLTLTEDNYINEFDGAEGWLAHANRLGKSKLPVLFVKSFVDAADEELPTNQAEIQLWTSGTANPKVIELEQQGAEQALLPDESLSWTVHWSACEVPSGVEFAAGSEELAALARAHAVGD